MKKIFKLVMIISLLSLTALSVEAKNGLGIKVGLNYASKLKLNSTSSDDLKGYSGINIGLAYKLSIPFTGLSLQPELYYTTSGSTLEDIENVSGLAELSELKLKKGFIELPVNIQYGLGLGPIRVFGQVSPFVNYMIRNKADVSLVNTSSSVDVKDIENYFEDNVRKFNYGIGLGGGVDLGPLQVTARYKWTLGTLQDFDNQSISSTISSEATSFLKKEYRDSKFSGFELGVVFFF